jgi:hypothetical protein
MKMKNETSLLTVPSRPSLRKHAFYGILALVSLLGLGMTQSARASYIVTLQEVGSSVVATGSGAFNLTALSQDFNQVGQGGALINPFVGAIFTGTTTQVDIDAYSGFSGPTSFGSNSNPRDADSGSGDRVGIVGSSVLIVPDNYVSGTALSDSSTYLNATFASLGVDPGTYVWTWGTGENADSFTLQIGPAGVPDGGSTVSLLGLASLGLVALRRKLRS